MKTPIDWLLEGEPFIEYRTRRDLLHQPEEDAHVVAARKAMLSDARVRGLLAELSAFPWTVIASHKSAGQPFHKMTFLADLGLSVSDRGVEAVAAGILKHRSSEGPFSLPMNISTSYGGSGEELRGWALCDAPLLVYALVKFGRQDDPAVRSAVEYLLGLSRPNGFPCAVSKELGGFRGPGRKDDPCPFATLAMLKLLSEIEEYRDSPASRSAAETLLALWQNSITQHPYIFYMGTDFRKLKVPFVWYDLMHVLDVLSRFSWLRQDARLQEMVALLKSKSDSQGRFTLESIWTAWKGWEFGQKKEPSRWLTLLAWRILERVGAN